MDRRKFVKQSATAAAGMMILPFPIFGKNAPSNKIVLAAIGLNGRGSYLAKCFSEIDGVEIGYLCDVEDTAIKHGFDAVKAQTRKPTLVKDIRKLVAMKDFDGVIVATPDHWHTPASLLALHNGKHVYVEKPCGHNAYEGEMLVEASKKYPNLKIQMGNQRRSMPNLIDAVQMVHEGMIGDTYYGRAWYNNNRKSIGVGKKVPVPSTLDFDLWQGPAPREEFRDNIVHYNWHWFWNWGTSETCNNGTHEIDMCRWMLGADYPTKVVSGGGRYAYQDDWQTPDTQTASFEFGEKKNITWEGRSCNNFDTEGSGRGFAIYGTGGTLINQGNDDFKIYDNDKKLLKESKASGGNEAGNTVSANGNLDFFHFHQFLNSIRGEEKFKLDILDGHKSVLLCHLANIAQRTGKTLHTDPSNGHILNDAEAMSFWKRKYEKGWEPTV